MGRVLIILVLSTLFTASSVSGAESTEVTLKWGESIAVGPFEITAIDFSEGTMTEDKEKCDSDNYTDYEKRLFGCMDFVVLKVTEAGEDLYDTVLSDHNITVDGLELTNTSTYEDDDRNLTIHATNVVTGYDIPTPYVELTITFEEEERPEEPDTPSVYLLKIVPEWVYRAYSEDEGRIRVTLVVENLVDAPLQDLLLKDSIPEGFFCEEELNWRIDLEPEGRWQTSYSIEQVNCTEDTYLVPQAVLEVGYRGELYNISSNASILHIYGSRIVLEKSIDGERVNVSVRNEGNRASKVIVTDTLPDGANLVEGVLNFTVVLQPDEEYTNSYTLDRVAEELPPATAEFYDYYNPSDEPGALSGVVYSIEIDIREATPETTPEATPEAGLGLEGSGWESKLRRVEGDSDADDGRSGVVDGIVGWLRAHMGRLKDVINSTFDYGGDGYEGEEASSAPASRPTPASGAIAGIVPFLLFYLWLRGR